MPRASRSALSSAQRRRSHTGGGARRAHWLRTRCSAAGAGCARGDQNISKSFVVQSQRERILDAVDELDRPRGLRVAEASKRSPSRRQSRSWRSTNTSPTRRTRSSSPSRSATARRWRPSKARSRRRATGAWPCAPGIDALFGFLATEPSFAQIALVDALIVTRAHGSSARRPSVGRVRADARARRASRPEASSRARSRSRRSPAGCSISACTTRSRAGSRELPELVPTATYIALAPFLGGEEAARIATSACAAKPRRLAHSRRRARALGRRLARAHQRDWHGRAQPSV